MFMFVAAAAMSFASCGNTQKPAEVVEEAPEVEVVEEPTLNAEDTAAVLTELGVATVEEADAKALQEKLDEVLAKKLQAFEDAKAAATEAVEGAAEAVEEAAENVEAAAEAVKDAAAQ